MVTALAVPLPGAADALSLHQVRTLSETRRVAQQHWEATDVQRRLHHVPGGAGDGRHDGCGPLAWWLNGDKWSITVLHDIISDYKLSNQSCAWL